MHKTSTAILLAVFLVGCPEDKPAPSTWTPVFDDLDGVLLSAWGTAEDDVFFAGGGLGSGPQAMALHYDGTRFRRIGADTNETFWWTWGAAADDLFWVGSGGVIFRGGVGGLTAMDSPTTETLFGVWGTDADDVWAVGGDALASGGDTDVILHWNGSEWTSHPLAEPTGVALFKVYGFATDDVFAVGQRGVILHWNGSAWARQDSGTMAPIFTVHGVAPDDVWAVGGPPLTLLHYDGSAWAAVDAVGLAGGLNGVSTADGGNAIVVGTNGVKWRRSGGAWFEDTDFEPWQDLHGAWLAPNGAAFVVGGNFQSPAPAQRRGVIGYYGSKPPTATLVP